ncbi:SMI1/KNR4 family protein [Paenibacillus sp. MBLB4367]|uniref:SMI1/KNR4 family protein n=1 Tax=Paenibacillus sp. MBLB4367 TaxID=3384767 RepID=UPI0039081768
MDIPLLIQQIISMPYCTIEVPAGIPATNELHPLPPDVWQFYQLCGGLTLYENKGYPVHIVPPEKFVLANPILVGELCEEDISSHWYMIADNGNGEYLTIDLHPKRAGRCFDSFWDRHGIMGDCAIIARSFTEMLASLVESKGDRWYWLKEDFISLGDAYDSTE